MEGRLKVVGDAIAELDASRDALLAQLAQVEALLTQAHAERADLEESRSVFEEGVAFSLDALQHQVMHSSLRRKPGAAVSANFSLQKLLEKCWLSTSLMHSLLCTGFQASIFMLVTIAPEGCMGCPGG